MCVSILEMTRADMFEQSLLYGKREYWFRNKMLVWFDTKDGIFGIYRRMGVVQVRKKFTEAEASVKILYQNRMHQSDATGGSDETKLLYTLIFRIFRSL